MFFKSAQYLKILLALIMMSIFCSFSFPVDKALNIVFIGDSITYGAGIITHLEDAPPVQALGVLRQKFGFKNSNISNQGISGYTTLNFLPGTPAYENVKRAAKELEGNSNDDVLLFSIMLGTNDSAEDGPLGAPVSQEKYKSNLETIIDSLTSTFPKAKFIIHRPIWYSPNAYNDARYMEKGLSRLQSYDAVIRDIVKSYSKNKVGWVYEGDKNAFIYFREHYKTELQPEVGRKGTYFLHPNETGAASLGNFWAEAIAKSLNHK